MRKDTKARAIPMEVKRAVAKRDSFDGWPCCINCGTPAPTEKPTAFSCAHFISRSQGGLGTEKNIVTLCPKCHYKYDQTIERSTIRDFLREYLMEKYPDWNEDELYYRRQQC